MHQQRGKKSPFLYTAVLIRDIESNTSKPSSTLIFYNCLGTLIPYNKACCGDSKASTNLNGEIPRML